MKILVYGCGVIGSYLVHTLCEAGNKVTVVSRGKWKEVLETKGLQIHHKLSRKDTVDYPAVIDAAGEEYYDIAFSVMQGQQQQSLLPFLAKVNTPLVVLVGNNPDAAKMEKELLSLSADLKTVLFGFQGTAGVRESDRVTCVSFGDGSMTIGGAHREASPEEKMKIEQAFAASEYDLNWMDDMEGWLYTHLAFILPVVYVSYALGCNLKKADRKTICEMLTAVKEGYDLLQHAGIRIRPVGDELIFKSSVKMGAVQALLYVMAKTSLGKLCAADHCRNAVSEMQWLDERFEILRRDHPESSMSMWEELRSRMPEWDELHAAYDRSKGSLATAMPDYANWMPKEMVYGSAIGSAALLTAGIAVSQNKRSAAGKFVGGLLTAGAVGCGIFSIYSFAARRAFSYDGERKLSKQIIEGVAEFVVLPESGVGLDVGCGSGALTIACAKRNPNASMVGIDHWGPEYKDFSKTLCERNAKAEGVTNVRFEKGDAVKLDFADGTFDAVTSNYVYHNIVGANKQDLLLETLRVLKKGGYFAIHDLMEKGRYGDMQAFVKKLKAEGYEQVYLIDTTGKFFRNTREAKLMMLGGSTLLFGKK